MNLFTYFKGDKRRLSINSNSVNLISEGTYIEETFPAIILNVPFYTCNAPSWLLQWSWVKRKKGIFNIRRHIICVYSKDIFPLFMRKGKKEKYIKTINILCGSL